MAIFVFGTPKSGMSVVEAILQALGVSPCPTVVVASGASASEASTQTTTVVRAVNDVALKQNNLDWRTLPTMDADTPLADIEGFSRSIEDALKSLDRTQTWSLCDPRLSFLFPHWKAAAKPASAILCLRRPSAVALSLKETAGTSLGHAVALWELYTLAALRNTRRTTRAVIIYEELVAKPETVIRKLIARLPELARLDPGPAAIKSAVACVQLNADRKRPETAPIEHPQATDLYRRVASGDLGVPNEHAGLGRALELVRAEAEREQTARMAAEAQEQLNQASAKLTSEKALFSRRAEKLRNIVSLISAPDQPVSTDWEKLLDQLYDAVRALIGPSRVLYSEEAVAGLLRAKDERIDWLKHELGVAGSRSQSTLDQLAETQVEVARLRAEREQFGLAKALTHDQMVRLNEDAQRLNERLSKTEQERAQAGAIIAALQSSVEEYETRAAALAQAANVLEHHNRELAEQITRDQERVAQLPVLEADIEHLRRELQRVSAREKELRATLAERDDAEKLLRATISQQVAAASTLQAELTLEREDADVLNARLAQQAALLAEYAALQFADRQALADADLHIQKFEAIAAESSQSSDRMGVLQAEVQRAQAERDNAIKALKSYEAAQDKQLGELAALARRAIAERDQALAGVAARDEAIRERDAALVEMHQLVTRNQDALLSS